MSGLVSAVWTIGCFVLVIGPLVFIHELGHYLVGRWFGVAAETFSIGFGRELFGWYDRRGTRWRVSLMPLGGYVKFAGDMNPASQPSAEWLSLPPAERARTFQAKPVWQRFLIVLAGPLTNFLFAIVVIAGVLAVVGQPVTPPVVAGVAKASPAQAAGLRAGDRVVTIDGHTIDRFEDIAEYTIYRPNTAMRIDVVRDGAPVTIAARTASKTLRDKLGNAAQIGQLGIAAGRQRIERIPFYAVPARATAIVGDIVATTATTLRQFVVGERSTKEMSGPIGIARLAGEQVSVGWFAIVWLMVMLSINLGFINLLPVPMLDGGHLVFYALEAVRRKPVEPRVMEWAFRSGLALLLGLMLLVTVNDLGSAGLWSGLAGLIG